MKSRRGKMPVTAGTRAMADYVAPMFAPLSKRLRRYLRCIPGTTISVRAANVIGTSPAQLLLRSALRWGRRMPDLPEVEWKWTTVLPENRPVYQVSVNGKPRLTVYVSATGRSVRVFDNDSQELKARPCCKEQLS